MFLKIFQNSMESTCGGISFWQSLRGSILSKRDSSIDVSEIIKSIYFIEHLQTVASGSLRVFQGPTLETVPFIINVNDLLFEEKRVNFTGYVDDLITGVFRTQSGI